MTYFDFTKLKNIGPRTAANLRKMGIKNLDEMKKLGTKELFWRYFESSGGWHSTMCSCWLYAIEGAITNTHWTQISAKKKTELRKYVHDLRNSFSQ